MTRSIVVVTRPTRLEGLRARWVTDAQAKFLISRAHAVETELHPEAKHTTKASRAPLSKTADGEADFAEYKQEDVVYQKAVESVERRLDFGLPVKRIDRSLCQRTTFAAQRWSSLSAKMDWLLTRRSTWVACLSWR
jgi:hypothetical protein